MGAVRVGVFTDDQDFFWVGIWCDASYRGDEGGKVGIFLYDDLALMVGLAEDVYGHEDVAEIVGEVGVLHQGVAWADNTFKAFLFISNGAWFGGER